jgi:hypothetical protein
MPKNNYTIVIVSRKVIYTAVCFLFCIAVIVAVIKVFAGQDAAIPTQTDATYVILATNESGMHCYQQSFASFMILPPANNLRAQIFKNNGGTAELINSGITVNYKIIDNTYSAGKTDFWQYAADYGYNVAPNIGITGNTLSGEMRLSADGLYYEATAIPITPYNDGSTQLNPYQLAVIEVYDTQTGVLLAETDNIVVPVSDEMDCSICHGTTDTDLNILSAHDRLSNTNLVAELANGKRYKCSDCHRDNILDMPGVEGIEPLSQAMHGFHADKMEQSDVTPNCYSCHPGPVTQCYRGQMSTTVSCVNSPCHGDMKKIAQSQADGRQAWLDELDCGLCHGELYSVNQNKLYRNSYLINNSNPQMNGIILCESCHNSPHAEWVSTNPKDNLLPESLLGYTSYINRCTVCHGGLGTIHQIIIQQAE